MTTYATWDAATANAVTLSGGGLVASNTGTTAIDQGVRVGDAFGKLTGKYYFEITVTTFGGGGNTGFGIGTTASTYTNMSSSAIVGDMVYITGASVYVNNTIAGSIGASLPVGTVVKIAVDLDNRKIWMKAAGGWNSSGASGNDPATNAGGFGIPAGTMVPFCTFNAAGNVFTANFGASAFVDAVPSGFTSGWPDVVAAFTTWNPADISGVVLSNGNLTVTANPSAGGVRGVHCRVDGKFYWEYTLTTNGSTWNFGAGIAHGGAPLTYAGGGGNTGPSVTVDRGNGYVWVSASGTATLGAIPTGNVVCVAADLTNRLLWVRVGAAGNWNGSATADPATGNGGRPFILGPVNWYPFAGFSGVATGQNVIANFGATAFAGAAPAGFTAGFPAGDNPPVAAGATQTSLEQWNVPDPNAMLTQIGIEQWAVGGNPVQAIATQLAIEQWASLKSGAGTQTRAMILA